MIVLVEALAVLVMAVLAVHDTNTATGAGYLLYITSGALTRNVWNIILDLFIILMMLVFVAIPVKILRADFGGAALFFLGVSAFAIYLRPDRLLAPFMGGEILSFADAKAAIVSWIPLWIICASVVVMIYADPEKEKPKFPVIASALSILSLILSLITPASEIFMFVSGYFVAMPFLTMGRKEEKESDPLVFRLIPASVFFLSAVWRLVMVLSTYHM